MCRNNTHCRQTIRKPFEGKPTGADSGKSAADSGKRPLREGRATAELELNLITGQHQTGFSRNVRDQTGHNGR